MRLLLFILSLACKSAVATSAMPFTEITPDNVEELGFDVRIEVTPDYATFVVEGPSVIDGNCFAQSSGSVLYDKLGVQVMKYENALHGLEEKPFSHGTYTTSGKRLLSVWITYICNEKPESSRRYLIRSISDYYERSAKP